MAGANIRSSNFGAIVTAQTICVNGGDAANQDADIKNRALSAYHTTTITGFDYRPVRYNSRHRVPASFAIIFRQDAHFLTAIGLVPFVPAGETEKTRQLMAGRRPAKRHLEVIP